MAIPASIDSLVQPKKVFAGVFDATTYALFTFGTLVFMIIGLFLPSVTKLKVAGVEMDKNAVDTVKASVSILAENG